ncbi:hypothetical protein [Micromonospora tarensis]|uniref:DUF3558 domain-containing protein n=1 Tax=Micromonospora tarensis TaxID=2806100 RepID=A0ABS1YN45_9ACTN|nr:hypothetical protein [Micromonospora tarensis]MBM0278856.1 hypothetical protein [Micromonospora tarensis]
MRPASTAAVTIALLATFLAGCTSDDRASTTSATPPGTASATAPATTATGTATGAPLPTTIATVSPRAGGAAPRVALKITGGFTGRGDAITVEPDGRWTVVDRAGGRRSGKLSPADHGSLTGLAADPRLAVEAGAPSKPTTCSDVMHYRLTVGNSESGYADCPADASAPPTTQAVVKLLLRATGTYQR